MHQDRSDRKETLSLHIAVCDDNIADRKQLERLLQREASQRISKSVVFYVDSYGNAEAAMRSPRLYDAFFIDMTEETMTGSQLGLMLLNAGITAPLIFCISSIDYRMDFPEKLAESGHDRHDHPVLYLDKPVKTTELTALLDLCISKKNSATASLELRCQHETYYVLEDDVVYLSIGDRQADVILNDGRRIQPIGSMDNLYLQLSAFSHFLEASPRLVINISHIRRLTPFHVLLSDGSSHPISLLSYRRIKKKMHHSASS